MNQESLDERIELYYATQFREADRLPNRSVQGRVELRPVQRIVRERIDAGSTILDIGGATGVHAGALVGQGYRVTVVDPVPELVAVASERPGVVATVGDARHLDFPSDGFDVALLFGPRYHLAAREDRAAALAEARRVVRTGGWIFVAAIPRMARFVQLRGDSTRAFSAADDDLMTTGAATDGSRFPAGHFHTAEELGQELKEAGLTEISVVGVEGPSGLALEEMTRPDIDLEDQAYSMAEKLEATEISLALSNHIVAIARVA